MRPIDRDMGEARLVLVVSAKTTGWLRETELVPKTQGIVQALKETKFALSLARRGKVPIPFPPHVAKDVKESAGSTRSSRSRASTAQPASSRASTR